VSWERDDLLAKACLYIERAYEEDRASALFPFWCALSLELLARAALAHVHPVLLADPQKGENILHALGYHTENPKSIPAKTVYLRCQAVVPRFTQRDNEFCLSLTHLRNGELHTGEATFEDLHTSQWLARFYRTCAIVLEHQSRTLADLLPADEIDAALTMLAGDEEAVKAEVLETIGRAQSNFDALDSSQRSMLLDEAELKARDVRSHDGVVGKCPSCSAAGVIEGERVSASETRLQDEMLHWETVILPTRFSCLACTLRLSDYERLEAAGLGGQYTIEHWADPVEHYGEQAIEAYMEPDYGND
jgi:hypothetical protein